MGDQPVARPTPANSTTQPSVARVGFEPGTAVCERARTVSVLDRAAAVVCINQTSNAFARPTPFVVIPRFSWFSSVPSDAP
jgi:hypothetical protein